MSLVFIAHRGAQYEYSRSSNGLYVVRIRGAEYVAFHITAVFDQGAEIGTYPTASAAESRCREHHAALLAEFRLKYPNLVGAK